MGLNFGLCWTWMGSGARTSIVVVVRIPNGEDGMPCSSFGFGFGFGFGLAAGSCSSTVDRLGLGLVVLGGVMDRSPGRLAPGDALLLAGSVSPELSNMEISDVVGGMDVVSGTSALATDDPTLSALLWPPPLAP